jgi:tRNA modification GTPase
LHETCASIILLSMNSGYSDTDDCIAALATVWGESALAVIRTSGAQAIERAAQCFSAPERLLSCPGGSILHGFLIDPETKQPLDEVTAAVYRAPAGYTGQNSVEIFCHGSMPGIGLILSSLRTAGFRDALPGEFTFRAFMNGKMDLTRAEAVREIVSAKSGRAHELALGRLSGTLFAVIDGIKYRLLQLLAAVEVQLDYAEDEIEEPVDIDLEQLRTLKTELRQLADTYAAGRLYAEGARVVLAGRTNSGKSSLFNLFLKEDRSIVSELHGTTRDYIESWITVSGIPIKLFDTAGYRSAEDTIEAEGIRRSQQVAESADLLIYVVDGTVGWGEGEEESLRELDFDGRKLVVWNKSDLEQVPPPAGVLAVSARTGTGFSTLEKELTAAVGGSPGSRETVCMIDSVRQKELLERAVEALSAAEETVCEQVPLDLTAAEIHGALEALGELTGEVTSSDILDAVFSGFCVGK